MQRPPAHHQLQIGFEFGVRAQKLKKFVAIQPQHADTRTAAHTGVARLGGEQRGLAEDIARPEHIERNLAAVSPGFQHPRPAGHEDVKRVGLVALPDDGLAEIMR